MGDVIALYGEHEHPATQALLLGPDPPHVVLEALRFYHATINRVRSDRDERERKKREARRKTGG